MFRYPLFLASAFCCGAISPAFAAPQYIAELDPVAFDNSTRANVVGEGKILAALNGATLTVSGSFTGLSSNATIAHLEMGAAKGVPGSDITTLTITGATSGSVSGRVTLTPEQLTALRAGGISVQIDSVKGTTGSLWGWLEPNGSKP